jgi:molybdate transport system substrate-binding protein
LNLSILSGGAAFGLVDGIREHFQREHACGIAGEFGAVGLMKEKLLSGHDCDVIILSRKLIDELAQDQHVDPKSIRDLGIVSTGIGVKTGRTPGPVDTQEGLRQALLSAEKIMVPHMTQSTAGIHMKNVFTMLGILPQIENKIQEFPNGATAMKALAAAPEANAIGCTQITEIMYTPGVQAVGALPPGCELDTIYSVAIPTASKKTDQAWKLVDMVSSSEWDDFKNSNGFKV